MNKVLNADFFERPVLDVAPDLLGKILVRKQKEKEVRAMITEVEAYDGPEDQACHARFGRTKRTEVMFGPAGHFYVYLCYGIHWMLNIVTGEDGYPSAVLIRAAVLTTPPTNARSALSGPGVLTKALKVDTALNGKAALPSIGLWIEEGSRTITPNDIQRTPRIGIDYAGVWAQKPWRYIVQHKKICTAEEEVVQC